MAWTWDLNAKRYRDSETGQFLSRERALEFVQASLDASGSATDTLASLAGAETPMIAPADWRNAMRQEIKDEYIRQYLLGRGGRDQMTATDWGSVGGMLKEQYGHLDAFAAQVDAGALSEGQIRARARMYVASAREAFERANGRAQGVPAMPAYPGDGSTVCLTNCKCTWVFEQAETGWLCYWQLGRADHCDDCLGRAGEWNPLFVEGA